MQPPCGVVDSAFLPPLFVGVVAQPLDEDDPVAGDVAEFAVGVFAVGE